MSDGLKQRGRLMVCCLLTALALTSCSESITNPDTPGSGLLTRDVIIRDTVLYATSDTSFLQRIPPDGLFTVLRQNLVGKSGNYKAYAAMRFTLGSPIDTLDILSAKITLRLVSWRGDSAGLLAFNVHRVNTSWSEATLTWPTADSTNFYDAAIKGSYSGTVGPDTQYIAVDIDTAMVASWFRSNTTTNNGIILVPTSNTSLIRGFHAFGFDSSDFQPKLEVVARGANVPVSDTTRLRFESQIGQDTYVADIDPFPLDPQHLVTQAGIAYRSRLRFDVSEIPRGAIINSAELQLQRNPLITNVSKFTSDPAPVVHALLTDDSTNFEAFSSPGALKSGTANTFTFDVRRQVQIWEGGTNYGLLLRQPSVNEFGTLDLFGFYSSNVTDQALRPRILIKYSVFQN
ncbi:MAG: DNRLRE domain-containing protein [Bacteroidetes bacterium]|nr:DNRLRE domain-containing protein [Bacteroidota bacterium]MCW5894193.1 DNRLRE domain-containing protein [Bacteroidota bacterium]